ncbi:MAG TPA: hypothetical protein VHO70_11855 [Chitinispirillaceae bacterium]|nr:hypothetical protein [Chitinispirillaceae bacterium]
MVLKHSSCLLVVFVLLYSSVSSASIDTVEHRKPSSGSVLFGISLIGLEFAGLPLLDVKYNYRKFPKLDNPFNYIEEREPFIQDELWHFVGASALTEVNYSILQNCFAIEKPYLLCGLMTFSFWTGMECLDALSGSGFSVRDELGNLLGVTFSLIKIRYPGFPFKVRIGVRDIRSFATSIQKAVTGSIHHQLGSQYDFMKVELICRSPDTYLYTGVAVTRTENRQDLYGITFGLDAVDIVNDLYSGWWNKPLGFITRHFSTGISFTCWLK